MWISINRISIHSSTGFRNRLDHRVNFFLGKLCLGTNFSYLVDNINTIERGVDGTSVALRFVSLFHLSLPYFSFFTFFPRKWSQILPRTSVGPGFCSSISTKGSSWNLSWNIQGSRIKDRNQGSRIRIARLESFLESDVSHSTMPSLVAFSINLALIARFWSKISKLKIEIAENHFNQFTVATVPGFPFTM